MNPSSESSSSGEERVNAVIADYLEAADDLQQFFADRDHFGQFFAATVAAATLARLPIRFGHGDAQLERQVVKPVTPAGEEFPG
jgi:hypothetical protein